MNCFASVFDVWYMKVFVVCYGASTCFLAYVMIKEAINQIRAGRK